MKHPLFPIGSLAALLFLSTHCLPASDWPEFRGPTAQGHVSGSSSSLPLHWSAQEKVLWKSAIPGEGWSSPSVSQGRVLVTTAVPDAASGGLSLRVLCLQAKTGRTQWSTEVFSPQDTAERTRKIHRKNSHASPTPLISGDRIYVHFGHQGTACLDLTGKVLWKTRELDYPPVHGSGGSPVLVDEVLIVNCDGSKKPFIAGLDRMTGKLLWKTPRTENASKKFSFCTPLVIKVKGKTQVISPASDMVAGYDPTTGRELWKVRYKGYSVVPRPVFGHGLVFISTGFDRAVVMAIRPDGQGDVTDSHVAWTLRKGAPKTPSMLLLNEDLYMVSDGGIASCVNARTGKVYWQERVGGNYSASPIHVDGRIYLQNEEGKGVVLRAGRTFKVLATNDLEERSLASYAVTGSTLLIRTASQLYAIGE